MLQITIPAAEYFDDETQMFVETKEQRLQLEHSLVSISKWESKWKKPYLNNKDISREESLDYIRCMTITQNVNPLVYYAIPDDILKQIMDYIADPMTATTFRESNSGRGGGEIITSEIIYYWMTEYNIPPEYQKWHFNRLMTLIKVCSIKKNPQKKMTKAEILRNNRELNAARRKKMNTKG